MFGRGRLHFESHDTIITDNVTGSTILQFPDLSPDVQGLYSSQDH
jgi:hypothetical protein